jgi:Ca2+-binding RTX toxin-like protein
MTLRFAITTTTAGDFAYDLGIADDIFVAAGILVGSTNFGAIIGVGSGHIATIGGSVVTGAASEAAVKLGDSPNVDSAQRLIVVTGGLLAGGYGAAINGVASHVENHGTMTGQAVGVYLAGIGTGPSQIWNTGTISGADGVQTAGTVANILTNQGYISGTIASFRGLGLAFDSVINRGVMIGNVKLGQGDDLYDGRGGSIEGTVQGEDGNDRFVPGAGAEIFDGGAALDILDFRYGAAVTVTLDGTDAGTGAALGDVYRNCEVIYGSLSGADTLIGSALADRLLGLGGADRLTAGDGADLVIGGGGVDVVSGGAGNDSFQFMQAIEGGDQMTDFSNIASNNDTFRISATGFGAGLVAGLLPAAQFQIRADNLAQDSSDHFIFRTADQTLWFDVNGNAAGGLTLLADLQAGATVTAADILVF